MALIKYFNRRIYDTEASAYFPITQIRDRVVKGERVMSKETELDVSHEVLLGIITYDLKEGLGPSAEQLRRFIQQYSVIR